MSKGTNVDGEVAMLEALAADDFKTARNLLSEQKIDPKVRDWTRSNMSPLAYAVRRNDVDFVGELIATGADVNGFAFGDIPLVALANAECADLLARAGADVNAKIKRDSDSLGVVQGATALIRAAHRADRELVAKLIELGADVNAVDRFGRTALHYAARSNGEAAKQLMAAGADISAVDRFGKTPRDYSPSPLERADGAHQQEGTPVRPAAQKTREEGELLQALEGYDFVIGDKLSLDHGEFLYLDGKDGIGEGTNFAVVPRAITLPVTRFSTEGELESYLTDQQFVTRERTAVQAFFLISQQRDRQAHEQIVAPPENAIIGIARTVSPDAINLGEYISRIEGGGGLSAGQGAQEGPETLLRGRYVRDGAGQYRRLGEEGIALVDDGDKIRFADKGVDTFQAAGELADAKDWKSVQVTGTEEFRANAWFSVRLAGLDVVGYEPTNKDLDRLQVAVENGLSSAFAGTAFLEVEGSQSRTASPGIDAVREAPSQGSTLYQARTTGTHVGKVMSLSADHLEQKVGRDPRNVVVHDRRMLSGDEVAVGQLVTVSYENGKGQLKNHDLAVEQSGRGR